MPMMLTTLTTFNLGLLLHLHPCSEIVYQYFMKTYAFLEDLTPMAARPFHNTVSVMLISPDSEQGGEDWH